MFPQIFLSQLPLKYLPHLILFQPELNKYLAHFYDLASTKAKIHPGIQQSN
jgi:hypothetical protein